MKIFKQIATLSLAFFTCCLYASDNKNLQPSEKNEIVLTEAGIIVASTQRTILPAALRNKLPEHPSLRQLVRILGPAWHPKIISSMNIMWCFDDGIRLSTLYSHDSLDKPVVLHTDKYVEQGAAANP